MLIKNLTRLHFLKSFIKNEIKLNRYTGQWADKIQLTHANEGYVRGEFTVAENHLNTSGKLHSGIIASIVDNFTFYTVVEDETLPGVTLNLYIRYLAEPVTGDHVVIESKAVNTQGLYYYLECSLKNKDSDALYAKGHIEFLKMT